MPFVFPLHGWRAQLCQLCLCLGKKGLMRLTRGSYSHELLSVKDQYTKSKADKEHTSR